LVVKQQMVPPHSGDAKPEWPEDTLVDAIRRLVSEEPFAVLCTQGSGQPYGSIIAFAFSEDLTACCFTTSVATRKHRLLSECDRVALVIDDRDRHPGEIMRTSALTVTGRAAQVRAGPEFERWAERLLLRHPYLKSFVNAPSTVLFRVDVSRFLHVARFQEVRQWIPVRSG
jgi:hypothetical protein